MEQKFTHSDLQDISSKMLDVGANFFQIWELVNGGNGLIVTQVATLLDTGAVLLLINVHVWRSSALTWALNQRNAMLLTKLSQFEQEGDSRDPGNNCPIIITNVRNLILS